MTKIEVAFQIYFVFKKSQKNFCLYKNGSKWDKYYDNETREFQVFKLAFRP